MALYDYRDGIAFYEQFRSSLVTQAGTSRVYAAGIAIILNAGLLHLLEKFKRKGSLSPRSPDVEPKTERQYKLPDTNIQELIDVLAGMMWSAGELYGTPYKDYP
jgi:hypothetical protein